ncbi:nitrous oxide reductase accessory protein NosL [Shewanella sp. D64]|uniref:nitrous oxide reductase accessory protein NosL n=1 Tax=unclassified Shewanella TaxID=196818 RepID=UPI0022BA17C6|nr:MULTISPECIES: nitrous oxide reductase accessory protein NosL [unclassified Shewanella]MEC4728013.1 nitrous oxide reductase accessory protein NosL [Shewanella sp. D64]MEC4740142.1 nitrous oxide reductase accessory protein NosL [Shewanella sp. E94]WBJ95202.1 nitrous oxide reductase accessory protein NosL [Shewanella sp. MTB7]
MKKLICLLFLLPLLSACSERSVDTAQYTAEVIHEHDRCHLCGMMITKYPGPKGQVHLKGQSVVPKFCSTRDMFNFALQTENKRQIEALFVHDAGATGWDTPTDDAFIDATTAWYVIGSIKKVAMGSAVASFKNQADAVKFAKEFGGAVLPFEQIDIKLLAGE